jgi:hypothetical protein
MNSHVKSFSRKSEIIRLVVPVNYLYMLAVRLRKHCEYFTYKEKKEAGK